jgi:hypothetical protein
MNGSDYVALIREGTGWVATQHDVNGNQIAALDLPELRSATGVDDAKRAIDAWHGAALSWMEGPGGWAGRPAGWGPSPAESVESPQHTNVAVRALDAVDAADDASDVALRARSLADPDVVDLALNAGWLADRGKALGRSVRGIGDRFRRRRSKPAD